MNALKLPPVLMHEQANDCLAQWGAQLPVLDKSAVEVDASSLEAFDSSALAVLLAFRRLLAAQGRTLQVTAMPQRLHQLADLYGVLDLLEHA